MNAYGMTPEAIHGLVKSLAASDGRLVVTPTVLDIWADNLAGRAQVDVLEAVRQWFREPRQGPPDPAALRRMAISAETSREARARARALEPGRPQGDGRMTLAEWRAANPGAWDSCRQEGQAVAANAPVAARH